MRYMNVFQVATLPEGSTAVACHMLFDIKLARAGDVSVRLLHKLFPQFMMRITISVDVLAEILLRSPRKIFNVIITKSIYSIKLSKKLRICF